MDLFVTKSAKFSPCRKYRYSLWRIWDASRPYVMFIGLNPSTADETEDDPTVRRCINYATAWGYGGLCMTNIFSFRTTDPKVMKAELLPIGPDNDKSLLACAKDAGIVIAAWGTHGTHMQRNNAVIKTIASLYCLEITKDGHPSHPLYLKKTLMPIPYDWKVILEKKYLTLLPGIREVARKHGYAIGVHGSLKRDFDLIAAPWEYEAASADKLAEAVRKIVGGVFASDKPTDKAYGRKGWCIHLPKHLYGRGYIDLSVMAKKL